MSDVPPTDPTSGWAPRPGEPPLVAPDIAAPTGSSDPMPSSILLEGPPDGKRPLTSYASLAGTGAGLLLVASLFLLLGEIPIGHRRIGGIAICALFQALGIGLMHLDKGRRAATAGVVLFGIGVIPLLGYLIGDADHPAHTLRNVHSFTTTTTAVLVFCGVVWLVVYRVGPGKRYGFFLGAALLAFWLVAMVQIIDQPLGQVFDPFLGSGIGVSTTFTPGGSVDNSGDTSSFPDQSSFKQPSDPTMKLGIASLLFGGAYLALAARADRLRDHRRGTVFFAVSVPILTFSVAFFASHLHIVGTSLVAMALGGMLVWLGAGFGRRFTSWYGTLVVAVAVVVLVDHELGRSQRATGLALGAIGLIVAVMAGRLETGRFLAAPVPGGDGGTGTTFGQLRAMLPNRRSEDAPGEYGPADGSSPWSRVPEPGAASSAGPEDPTGPAFTPPPAGPWLPHSAFEPPPAVPPPAEPTPDVPDDPGVGPPT